MSEKPIAIYCQFGESYLDVAVGKSTILLRSFDGNGIHSKRLSFDEAQELVEALEGLLGEHAQPAKPAVFQPPLDAMTYRQWYHWGAPKDCGNDQTHLWHALVFHPGVNESAVYLGMYGTKAQAEQKGRDWIDKQYLPDDDPSRADDDEPGLGRQGQDSVEQEAR